ncbi:hypothetical protein NGM37_12700, partial [Streptomyces sp. TRM76130]|nr:hypothetical protein [Streptomyces sp. TRM76130]
AAAPAASPRDPWQEGDGVFGMSGAGATGGTSGTGGTGGAADHEQHDPHEVTVQLDAVQLGDGVLRRAA